MYTKVKGRSTHHFDKASNENKQTAYLMLPFSLLNCKAIGT